MKNFILFILLSFGLVFPVVMLSSEVTGQQQTWGQWFYKNKKTISRVVFFGLPMFIIAHTANQKISEIKDIEARAYEKTNETLRTINQVNESFEDVKYVCKVLRAPFQFVSRVLSFKVPVRSSFNRFR